MKTRLGLGSSNRYKCSHCAGDGIAVQGPHGCVRWFQKPISKWRSLHAYSRLSLCYRGDIRRLVHAESRTLRAWHIAVLKPRSCCVIWVYQSLGTVLPFFLWYVSCDSLMTVLNPPAFLVIPSCFVPRKGSLGLELAVLCSSALYFLWSWVYCLLFLLYNLCLNMRQLQDIQLSAGVTV